MRGSDYQDVRPKGWRFLCRAAIFETNTFKKLRRISEAEQAIVERMQEIFRDMGPDAQEEREAMDDAMCALRGWKSKLQPRNHAA